MNKIKTTADRAHQFAKDNVIPLVTGALIGAYMGGYIVAKMAYAEGKADASKALLKDLINAK
jgi:hypothetical protein